LLNVRQTATYGQLLDDNTWNYIN